MKRVATPLLLIFVCIAASAEEKPVTISGYVFGDYYYVATSHDPGLEGENGFWVRRAYLTFDRDLGDSFSARLRFEANQPGDFETNATMEPFVKDAYIKWKQSSKLDILLGISPTPTWETLEKWWPYRSVERTPVDLFRLGNARDFGIALVGSIDDAKKVRYHFIAGNGASTGSETNAGKKVALSIDFAPTKEMLFEIYGDRDERPGDDDRTTLQTFAVMNRGRYRAGLHYARQMRADNDVDLASAFGVVTIKPTVAVLGRVDRIFDPIPEADRIAYLPLKSEKATLYIAGIDWKMHEHLNLIPNVEVVHYDDGDSEILPRVTFHFTF